MKNKSIHFSSKRVGNYQLLSDVQFIMGTAFTSQIVVKNKKSHLLLIIEEAQEQVIHWLSHIDDNFSPFKESSELNRYLRAELDYFQLSEEMKFVLASCGQAKNATRGAFDASLSGKFNPSGFVKGWAIEQAVAQYLQTLLKNPDIVAVNLIGGGDMQFLTRKDSDWKFAVAIVDPFDRMSTIAQVKMSSGAIATSGIAERGSHIYGADQDIVQTTVIGQNLQEVDVWATALMVQPTAKIPDYLKAFTINQEKKIHELTR